MEDTVLIIGAGPAGLAVSNCLSHISISNTILEREDCCASLWRKRAYDRLRLHLDKDICALPYMRHGHSTPTYMSKDVFINYIDSYVSRFNINPRYSRTVQSASYDEDKKKWVVEAKNALSGEVEVYVAQFLVVASGENGQPVVPRIQGLDSFRGSIVHSSEYRSGVQFKDRAVLVVGCGNSGMEIAYDLFNHGAYTSIVIRKPMHVVHKRTINLGIKLLKFVRPSIVDSVIMKVEKLLYGNLSKYGIKRPAEGPFKLKMVAGRSPVIDVGTIKKIKAGQIQVHPGLVKIDGNNAFFANGLQKHFDAIVLATGYRSTARDWLKNYDYILNEDGMPKNRFPVHWKGRNGIYCAGLSGQGIDGIKRDAKAISADINSVLNGVKKEFK